MKKYKYPNPNTWEELAQRPAFEQNSLQNIVSDILQEVKNKKDQALLDFTERFDGVKLSSLLVSEAEIQKADGLIDEGLKDAVQLAKQNIETFHAAQLITEKKVDIVEGVKCWRKSVGIDKVGLYIPGGTAPLFSTILMLGVPATLAGCKEIILCTPPNKEGEVHPAIIYVAQLVGIQKIFKVGGAQAVAAMAYGTETIPAVNKIFGPGNQFVTKAKEMVQQQGVAIDMPAGPSEVLVIADKTAQPAFVAADLLSQAEHGADSQVILLSNDEEVIDQTMVEIEQQLKQLPRKEVAAKSLENSRAILLESMDKCLVFSNQYAPEHLILASDNADSLVDKVTNAGSVFIGHYSCESAGDYASGTNHTLPTNGYAKSYSGVSIDSFVKKITFQKLTKQGLQTIGSAIEKMAEAEGLMAHKNAVSIRLLDEKIF